jgi:hypothetical protein
MWNLEHDRASDYSTGLIPQVQRPSTAAVADADDWPGSRLWTLKPNHNSLHTSNGFLALRFEAEENRRIPAADGFDSVEAV